MPHLSVLPIRHLPGALLLVALTVSVPAGVRAQDYNEPALPAAEQPTAQESRAVRMPVPPPSTFNRGGGSSSRAVVFFPPDPPRLRAGFPSLNPGSLRRPAPRELAGFVNEPFYAPLGTRLFGDSLPPALEARIAAFQDKKLTQQRALLARYEALAQADPITRERELSAFAVEQTPALAALEDEAEEIRRKLIRWRDDWNSLRQWKLGQTGFRSSEAALNAQYQVLRAAAYYEKALSPAQRRLIREVAMDLSSLDPTPIIPVDYTNDFNPLLSFFPETSRILLPPQLPNELADMIAAFESEKSAIKQELSQAIYEGDTALFTFIKNHRIEQLARNQAPRIALLEQRAEEIRKVLITLPNLPGPPSLPYLPPTVAERLSSYHDERRALQVATGEMVRDLQDIVELDRIVFIRTEEGRNVMRILLAQGRRDEQSMAALNARMSGFSREHERTQARLIQEMASIRQDLIWLSGGTEDETTARAVDRLIEEYGDVHAERHLWEQYREYHIAVLEPGLSPEQRRLVYDAALVKLDMPLPGGTLQPTNSAGSPARRQPSLIGQSGTTSGGQFAPGAERSSVGNPTP